MLTYERLTQLTTEDLKKRRNFHQIALMVVWFGGGIAIGAVLATLVKDDYLAFETLSATVFALLASIPVFIQKRKIISVLKTRH